MAVFGHPSALCGLLLVSFALCSASPGTHSYSSGVRHNGDGRTHTFSQSSFRNDAQGVSIENERHSYTDNSLSLSNVVAPPGSVIVNGNNQIHRRPDARSGSVIVNGEGNVIGSENQGFGLHKTQRIPRQIQINDNRIDVNHLKVDGSAQIFIGHGRRQKKDGESMVDKEDSAREKRSHQNTQIEYNDRRVSMNNVRAGSGSVIIAGHGNTIGKRSVDAEQNSSTEIAAVGEEETNKVREKRWFVRAKGEFSHTHHESANRHMSNVRAGDGATITNGDGNRFQNRRKRSEGAVQANNETADVGEEEKNSVREKRWGVGVKGKFSHTRHQSANRHMIGVSAGDYATITNGDGNRFQNKRFVEAVPLQEETVQDSERPSRQKRWFVRGSVKHSHTHHQSSNREMINVRAGDYATITNGDGNEFRNKRSEEAVQEYTKIDTISRGKRAFRGAVHIVDRRTRPGPPVNLDNLHGEGSVQIVIDDNTDPVSLRNARVIGAAQVLIQ